MLDCLQRRSESAGRPPQRPKPTHTKQVTVGEIRNAESTGVDTLDLLYSSSDEEAEVCLVRVGDEGQSGAVCKLKCKFRESLHLV